MKVIPNPSYLSQLLSVSKEQFVVPSYQRRYAWGHQQLAALFDDIHMLKGEDSHFFGLVILHTEGHHGGLNRLELVDGQQRITTLTLLLRAIELRYRDLGRDDKADDIRKALTCEDPMERKHPKVVLGDLDNDDYHALMTGRDREKFSNERLRYALYYFNQRLGSFEAKDLNQYYSKLTSEALTIRLDVPQAQDAYKLFETINNRGLRLTATDIVKNFLLGHAAKIDRGSGLLGEVKDLWSSTIIALDAADTDDFLRHFMCALMGRKITKSQLVVEFKKYYLQHVKDTEMLGEFEYYLDEGDEDEEEEAVLTEPDDGDEEGNERPAPAQSATPRIPMQTFLKRIHAAAVVYGKVCRADFKDHRVNRRIKDLHRILARPTYIFLMHYMQRKDSVDVQVKVLGLIATIMLRRHVCARRTAENDDIFAKMLPVLDKADVVTALRGYLVDSEHFPDDAEFQDSFPKHELKGRLVERARYILESIEQYNTGGTYELSVNPGSEVHLEHIIPEKITTKRSKRLYGDWQTYLGANAKNLHKRYVHRIGNMTLLAAPLNIQASNNPYAAKKKLYKKSNIGLTKALATLPSFNFKRVEKRGADLAGVALKIWSLK